MTGEPLHEVVVSGDGATVWVNGPDGSCIGRFSKRFGIDVHHTGTRQAEEGRVHLLYARARRADRMGHVPRQDVGSTRGRA